MEPPDHVTHYYLESRPPFLNLSDLDEVGLVAVLQLLTEEHAGGVSARVFGNRYMAMRRQTEERLRAGFLEVGGEPERASPHYFVIGSSRWYEGLADRMCSLSLPIADLPSAVTSFTYPDSFTSMGLAAEFGLPYEPKPYHGRVFRIERLQEIVEEFGLPTDGAGDHHDYWRRPFERYLEVQLWSDGPISAFVGPAPRATPGR